MQPEGEEAVVIAILERQNKEAALKLAADVGLHIKAPEITIRTKKLQSHANELLSHTVHRQIVEEARTLNAKIRVVEVERDQRITKAAEDSVRGALWQQFGSWLSNTLTEVRHKASSFIYDKYSK